MVRTRAARSGCAVLVLTVALSLAAPPVAAASKSDPSSAKAIAALLAAKKLGCRDFSSANESTDESTDQSSTDATASTLPSALQQLALLLEGADLGTCTIDGLQTLLVAFENPKGRRDFEGTLGQLPCAIVQAALPSSPTASAPTAGATSDIAVPLVDVGTRAIVFSTGTAPETDQVDLAKAATADASIAAKLKGKVRTFTFHCA